MVPAHLKVDVLELFQKILEHLFDVKKFSLENPHPFVDSSRLLLKVILSILLGLGHLGIGKYSIRLEPVFNVLTAKAQFVRFTIDLRSEILFVFIQLLHLHLLAL